MFCGYLRCIGIGNNGGGLDMQTSRRARIIELWRAGKSRDEILCVLDREFPPGLYKSSNANAIYGTLRDLKHKDNKPGKARKHPAPGEKQKPKPMPPLPRHELIHLLSRFDSRPVIQKYIQKDLVGKSPNELLAFAMSNLHRSFTDQTPSERYRNWRWYGKGEKLLHRLDSIHDQSAFDRYALILARSLVEDWGPLTNHGEPNNMNIGVAMKVINLLLKHLVFSGHCQNNGHTGTGTDPSRSSGCAGSLACVSPCVPLLHVPWDKYTLRPLRIIWQGSPPIPSTASQGFVKTLDLYQQLHTLITDISREAGVPRIYYEFWAWDAAHQSSSK